uniref:ARAD1C07876p n=1 Tax=Blastobotrys adeninivorans TaxID=409370 RepID=A0A060SZX4_BLAAD
MPGLSYEDISFYFKYDDNLVELTRWLRKVVPIAKWGSLTHDIVIDIENGFVVGYKINAIMREYGARGRVTAGLLGYYSIVLHSAPHFTGTKFIQYLCDHIAAFLGVQDVGEALFLRSFLVTETRTESRIFQDEVAGMLVPMVEDYCKDHFGESKIPIASAESKASKLYTKEPDQSFQPHYHVGADNSTDLPTAICEVTMGGQVGRLVFNCLSSFAGSGGKIDLLVGVDLAFDNRGLTGIRLFVFDTTITTLVRFAGGNVSVALFTKSKIENRLIHLRQLHNRLHEDELFEDYLQLEHTIEPTIQYYERMQEYLSGLDEGDVTDADIVETCRVVLLNAEVIQMTREDGKFSVTDITGESLGGLAVKIEPFLGLLLGFEAQVVLDVATLRTIYSSIARRFSHELGFVPVSVPLVLTKRHIANEKYSEFIASQGVNFNRDAFEQGQPVTAHDVALRFLNEENVIDPLAEAYLGKTRFRSKDMRMAAAYYWLEMKCNTGTRKYNLGQYLKNRQEGTRGRSVFLWSNDYTNLVNEFLDIHPTTPEGREYFRLVLGHRAIKDLLDIDIYKRALAQIINRKGSITALLQELGEDKNEALLRLEYLLTKAV